MLTKIDVQERYNGMINLLQRQREEINLKIHLGSMEVKEEWAALEKNFEFLKSKGKLLKNEAQDSAHEVEETIGLLGEELKEGYQRIRKLL